jgi:hypothetical protein
MPRGDIYSFKLLYVIKIHFKSFSQTHCSLHLLWSGSQLNSVLRFLSSQSTACISYSEYKVWLCSQFIEADSNFESDLYHCGLCVIKSPDTVGLVTRFERGGIPVFILKPVCESMQYTCSSSLTRRNYKWIIVARTNYSHIIVACSWRLYKTGIGLTTGFIGSHSYTQLQCIDSYSFTVHCSTCRVFLQLQLTLTTESQFLLSFSRAQDLLQTQLALTGHQPTLQPSSHLRLLTWD